LFSEINFSNEDCYLTKWSSSFPSEEKKLPEYLRVESAEIILIICTALDKEIQQDNIRKSRTKKCNKLKGGYRKNKNMLIMKVFSLGSAPVSG
jgi:hypothetical protein